MGPRKRAVDPNEDVTARAKSVSPTARAHGGVRHVPPIELSERARNFVNAYGTTRAREMLGGVSAEALARVVAGMTVLRGTVALMQRALADRDRAARARGDDGVA